MNRDRIYLLMMVALLAAVPLARAQATGSPPQCRQHAASKDSDLEHRGNQGMGFDRAKTTHHFLLTRDGGAIQVEAKDANDAESRDQIRMHLQHIAQAFAHGDFDIPRFVHDQVPPGVGVMKSRKDKIQYDFESTNRGGRVVVRSADPEALAAIHEFLTFQIREHKTGDPGTVE